MDAKFEAILNNLPAKQPRSHLEPYRGLIHQMRKRGFSYREISQVLKKQCGLKVGSSTVNDFVLAQARSKDKLFRAPSKKLATNKDARALIGLTSTYKDSEGTGGPCMAFEDTARTIKAVKDKLPRSHTKKRVFEYNPDEPLRIQRNHGRKE
jgi:hypothetical protein